MMKNNLHLILWLSLFSFKLGFAQTLMDPYYLQREVNHCDIVKIERNIDDTRIYFKYQAPSKYKNGGWVCIGDKVFIRDCASKTIYKLLSANGIPICPLKYNFQREGESLEFNLVFEPLPSSTTQIDIIENAIKRGFDFYGVNVAIPDEKILKSQSIIEIKSKECLIFKKREDGKFIYQKSSPLTSRWVINETTKYISVYLDEKLKIRDTYNFTPKTRNAYVLVLQDCTLTIEFDKEITFITMQFKDEEDELFLFPIELSELSDLKHVLNN